MPRIPRRILIVALVEALAFGMSIVLGALWIWNPSGPYEPFLVVAGLFLVATEAYRRYEGCQRRFKIDTLLQQTPI